MFKPSGKLLEDTNKVGDVILTYAEPSETHLPSLKWRLYTFLGDKLVKSPTQIHQKRHYLFGTEQKVADIVLGDASCSAQHAVIQYRAVQVTLADKRLVKAVKPYLLDLDSENGTRLNGSKIQTKRYYELRAKDNIRFASDPHEYVLLNEKSK